jgi:hypothetical protein
MGYGAIANHVRYIDQTTNRENLNTHHTIDEAQYGKNHCPPGPHILMDMGYEQKPVLPAITTPPHLSRYPLRSCHKSVTPLFCKLLPLLMNEFTSAPITIVASITTSDIDRKNSVTVTFSTDTFGLSFRETIFGSGIHLTISLEMHYDVDRHHCQLVQMALGMPSHRLSQWKSCLCSACILSIDTKSVHTIDDVRLVISEACSATTESRSLSHSQKMMLQIVSLRSVLAVVHKYITGPKFNHRTL